MSITSLRAIELLVRVTILSPVATAPATTQGRDSVIERTFAASPGGLLTFDLGAGGGITVRGWDDDRVRVRAVLAGANWRDLEVRIERESNGVRVAARFNPGRHNYYTSHHFEVMVPRRYDVQVSSSGGEVILSGIEGRFTGSTAGGELNFERLTGSVRLSTGGGKIDVRDADLSGTVSTGGGTVRISNVRGGLRGSSGSGPVIYGESADGRSLTGVLNLTKAGGDINLDGAPHGASVRTGGGNVTIGPSAGRVEASTGVGDVTVGPVAGSVIAGTGVGQVRIIVDRGRGEEQMIEAFSGYGRIVVELPADFDGRLDLESAYTRSNEDKARIRSDWDLERDPLTDWEVRYGMPRRTLRARAVLGRGNGRVAVRALNGEIEIRRR